MAGQNAIMNGNAEIEDHFNCEYTDASTDSGLITDGNHWKKLMSLGVFGFSYSIIFQQLRLYWVTVLAILLSIRFWENIISR